MGWRTAGIAIPFLAAIAVTGAAAGPLRAQQMDGRALGPDGAPLEGVPVALHRVGGMGGSSVATAVTDAEGRFRFDIRVADSAVYFAAMRYDDRMYIGPPARGGSERVVDYVIRADPSAEAGRVASDLAGSGPAGMPPSAGQGAAGGAGGAAGGDAGALALVALLGVAAAAVFLTTAPRYRRRQTREALIELAALENRLAAPEFEGDRAEAERRRDRIRDRLAPSG